MERDRVMTTEDMKDKMREMGIKESTINSKCFETCVLILTEAQEGITGIDLVKVKNELDARHKELECKATRLANWAASLRSEELRIKNLPKDTQALVDKANAEIEERINELKSAIEKINECETPEGRDLLRRAQMFIDLTDVQTKYDNTAYIVALGAILSAPGSMDCIKELKKINRKLPDIGIYEDMRGIVRLSDHYSSSKPWEVI